MTDHTPDCAAKLDPRIVIKEGVPVALMHYCGCHRTRELRDEDYGREKRRHGYAAAIHDAISAVNDITASLVPDPRGPEWINVIPKEQAIKAILGCHDAIDREQEVRDGR